MNDPYGYAWNAEILCEDCARDRMIGVLTRHLGDDEAAELHGATTEKISRLYATHELKVGKWTPLSELDTCMFPQPSWDSETLADSCGSCLTRIEDTL